jgi:hypothetical protein
MGFFLVFRRYAPFGFGFEGDHRSGPSVSMRATARTIGTVPFDRGCVGSMAANINQYGGQEPRADDSAWWLS